MGESGEKSTRAENIINSVRYSYENHGEDDDRICKDLVEFGKEFKDLWKEMMDLKLEDQKKYLQDTINQVLRLKHS